MKTHLHLVRLQPGLKIGILLPAFLFLLLLHTNLDEKSGASKVQTPGEGKSHTAHYVDPMASGLLKRAEWASENGAYTTALAICDQIDKRVSNFDYAYFIRGQALTKLNRHEEAKTALERVVEINADFPAIHFNLGNNAVQRGQYHEALHYYHAEHAAVRPDDPLVKKRASLLQMGKVYKELGEIDKALAAFQQVVQLDENCHEVYDEIGHIYQENGQLEKALHAKMRALELNPENDEYSYYVGALLFQLGRPGEAIPYLEKVKEKRPWFYGVYYNLGRSLLAVGRNAEGERYLAMVDRLQDRNAQLGVAKTSAELHGSPDKWLIYAGMLYEDKRYEEALAAYQVANSLDPRNPISTQAVSKLKRVLAKR